MTTAGLISESATAPTMPTGYTHKGLVGAIYNSSGSDLVDIYQTGGRIKRVQTNLITDGTATSLTQLTISAACPPNAKKILLRLNIDDSAAASSILTVSLAPENASTFQQVYLGPRVSTAVTKGGIVNNLAFDFINGAPELWYLITGTNAAADIDCVGWEF